MKTWSKSVCDVFQMCPNDPYIRRIFSWRRPTTILIRFVCLFVCFFFFFFLLFFISLVLSDRSDFDDHHFNLNITVTIEFWVNKKKNPDFLLFITSYRASASYCVGNSQFVLQIVCVCGYCKVALCSLPINIIPFANEQSYNCMSVLAEQFVNGGDTRTHALLFNMLYMLCVYGMCF